ncbi:hypothetical protein [Streptomyces sp. NPDC015345]|uniref:hypothetical protein n=1 Tax=Streptomyces sp. NPDC015345 TaxID=3364953 RepID=UPI0037024CB6
MALILIPFLYLGALFLWITIPLISTREGRIGVLLPYGHAGISAATIAYGYASNSGLFAVASFTLGPGGIVSCFRILLQRAFRTKTSPKK